MSSPTSKRFFLTLLIIALLAVALWHKPVLAQASLTFDLGCWGITVGGAVRQSPNFTLHDTTGQWASGVATSPNAIVRGGHVQDWGTIFTTPDPVPPPTPSAFQIYLPVIGNNLRVVRSCAW
ncbi:MAG: hypothetical protein KF832_14620 [Caldilineaceae bacterium]|nr:hypothetical protein [Caldilineaceae bacterium]